MDPVQNMPTISLPPIDPSDGTKTMQPQTVVANQPLAIGPTDNTQEETKIPEVSTPPVADDVDLIEKEWVNKVKEIVEKTKNDPYEQSKQLTVLKADYLQKRYNKSIKLT